MSIRCNQCMAIFEDEDDLAIMHDDDGYFRRCPTCNTDEYLMDIDKGVEQ